jgi:hypothetical protein
VNGNLCSSVCLLIHLYLYLFIYSFTNLLNYLLVIYLLIHLFTYLFHYLLIYLCIFLSMVTLCGNEIWTTKSRQFWRCPSAPAGKYRTKQQFTLCPDIAARPRQLSNPPAH